MSSHVSEAAFFFCKWPETRSKNIITAQNMTAEKIKGPKNPLKDHKISQTNTAEFTHHVQKTVHSFCITKCMHLACLLFGESQSYIHV